jgi:hypothetical protein
MSTGHASADPLLKLNLGCGSRRFDGYVGVDKHGTPDVRHDLEVFPWPWPDSSVAAVKLIHVLEHLGRDPDVFIGIMKELHRVCAAGARIEIAVPHPRHDNFLGDPTHVRPITLQTMQLFDRELCQRWQAEGFANTPLALLHGVDFRIASVARVPDEPYLAMLREKRIGPEELAEFERSRNNVISEIRLELEVRK